MNQETEEQYVKKVCESLGISYEEYKAETDQQLEYIKHLSLDDILAIAARLKPLYEKMVQNDTN